MYLRTYLSGNEALYGIGEHHYDGKEEPSRIGHWIVVTIIIEKITWMKVRHRMLCVYIIIASTHTLQKHIPKIGTPLQNCAQTV